MCSLVRVVSSLCVRMSVSSLVSVTTRHVFTCRGFACHVITCPVMIKMRQLREIRREEITTQMIYQKKTAVVIRREMPRPLKDFGNKYPPIIPKGDVLHKAKEQQLFKMYGLEFAFGPLNFLRESQLEITQVIFIALVCWNSIAYIGHRSRKWCNKRLD